MYIDPQVKKFLDDMAANDGPPPSGIEETRTVFSQLWRSLAPARNNDVGCEEITIPGPHGEIPALVYRPLPHARNHA